MTNFVEWIVNRIGKYLAKTAEAIVTFDSATPNWKAGTIRLNNLHLYCMPRSIQTEFRHGLQEREPQVTQGDLLDGVELDEEEKENQARLNKTPWFDVTIETLEVELSLVRFMEGKGLVQRAELKGVRGIIDNRRANWNKGTVFDYEAIRKKHQSGGFELEHLSIDDLSVMVYMPTGFRPFPINVLQAQLCKFRKQW